MDSFNLGLIREYLNEAGHSEEIDRPLFRPVLNNGNAEHKGGNLEKALNPTSVYREIVRYMKQIGIYEEGKLLSAHTLRATMVTNALDNGAPIEDVAGVVGHSKVSTTQLYDRRERRHEDSPIFKVNYGRRANPVSVEKGAAIP